MIYRVGSCDDEVSTCSQIENVVRELFKNRKETVETYVWNSGEGIIRDINAKVDLDILFLDIELPVYNGVEVGRYIRNSLQNGLMHIIYISSKTNYAMELFKIHPYDFLVKPIDKDRIIEIIDKTILINENDRRFFTYVYNRNQYNISYGEILYFESKGRYISIITNDNVERKFVGKLKNLLELLPENFAMTGQSYIINFRHMKECNANAAIMDNGACISISRNFKKDFSFKLMDYNRR